MRLLRGFGGFCFTLLIAGSAIASEPKPFDPKMDVAPEFAAAKAQAAQEHKNVLLDFGADWCAPCMSLDRILHSDAELNGLLEHNYVLVHVTVGMEKDPPSTRRLRRLYPRFLTVPHLLVVSSNGKLLRDQPVNDLIENPKADPEKVRWSQQHLAAFLNRCGSAQTCK